MGRCSGRAWAYAAFALLVSDVFAGGPSTAFSQDGEEVIADPELASGNSGGGSGADGDETIADPELSGVSTQGFEDDYGWGSVYTPKTRSQSEAPPEPEEEEYDPLANTGIGKLSVVGQQVFDLHRENLLEDFYETRLRFSGEVDFRISRKLRLSLGTRLDFLWAAPHHNDTSLQQYSALDQDRFEIDILPLAAYADWTAGEGVHLRLGTQPVSMGRMDGFSMTDMLVVLDLRPGPRADPATLRLAQPAVRLDWDLSSWATLQAVYVPWFMPHLSRGTRDRYVEQVLIGSGLQGLSTQSVDFLDPSYETRAAETALRLVGPAPDFRSPQAQARLNFRGSSFEFALVGGTAIEKLPSIYYIPLVDQLLRGSLGDGAPAMNPNDLTELALQAATSAANGSPIFDVAYHRYNLLGFDGSFDISPIQIGFEFAYSPALHLYTVTKDGSSLPLPNVSQQICNPESMGTPCEGNRRGNVSDSSIRKGVPVVMGALHVEWLKGETFMLAGEAYLVQALELPYDRSRDWLGTVGQDTGMFVGGLVTAAYQVDEGRWHFDLTTLLAPGPSMMLAPEIELRVKEGLYLNVGAQFYEGPAPIIRPGLAPRNITYGGMLAGYDNVYLGFRWLP